METITKNNTQSKELTIIDKSIEIFKGGGQILLTNQARASKALQVGENILRALEDAGGKMDELLDARCNKYLVNCNTAIDEMQALRKPITQLMDNIKKMFTEEENKLDAKKPGNIGYQIQQLRNQYALDLAAEQERLRKEAEARAAKAHEANELRSYIRNAITQKLLDYLAGKKMQITDSFNIISLETFEAKAEKLKAMTTVFPLERLQQIIVYSNPSFRLHDFIEYNKIMNDEYHAFDFPSFYREYDRQIAELKQSLVDRLPAKKEELQKLAAANEEEKARLEEQRKQRELEENVRLQKEEDQRKLEAEQKADMEKTSASTQIMFDQAADTAEVMMPAPETRSGYEITIVNKTGIVELFQFWFTREAVTCSIEDMMKKSLAQIKAYAEAVAKKDDVKIESKHLKYESSIKSVNRKIVKS